MKPKILLIVGPTASGKSALAVELARRFYGEIVSADSRQVYRRLNIGTGKITRWEMKGVRHHLLDVADPKKRFTVVDFVGMARAAIAAIAARGKLPIVCGGTGFYISALLGDETIPDVPPNEKLRRQLAGKSASELLSILKKLNPTRAKIVDQKNSRRIIRAIEIATALGKVPAITKTQSRYIAMKIGLILSPKELKKKITIRLFARISRGMIAEATKLHTGGLSWKRMEELGLEYRYLARFLRKKISRKEMLQKLNTEIWRYAKRQMTWFKRDKKIKWFKPSDKKKISKIVKNFFGKPPSPSHTQ